MEKIEFLILTCLINQKEYLRKVLPFIKNEYFEDNNQKVIFEEINKFASEYNDIPTKEVLLIETEKRNDVTGDQYNEIVNIIKNLDPITVEFEWLEYHYILKRIY